MEMTGTDGAAASSLFVRVIASVSREGAHRFELLEGFEPVKTSAVLEKILL